MTTRALYRNSDPATSREAAEAVTPRVSALEQRVLDAMRQLGRPVTSREIADRAGLDLVTVSPRLAPLFERGLVQKVGTQKMGMRNRIVWAIASDAPQPPAAA